MVDSNIKGCVLYQMSVVLQVQNNHILHEAQTFALEHDLPLAVIYMVEEHLSEAKLARLCTIEKELEELNIPLMLLIGDPDVRMAAMRQHTAPLAIYNDTYPSHAAAGSLQTHPHKWPGRVMSIGELQDRIYTESMVSA
jgi:hypothetical protein